MVIPDKFLNKILCGSSEILMHEIPSESVDMGITSPPYGGMRLYNGFSFKFEEIAQEYSRVLKPGGVLVWVVGDQTIKGSESLDSFRQALYFKDVCNLRVHDTMIYQKKTCTFPETNRYYQCFEYVFIFSKGTPKTVNLIKDRRNITGGVQKIHGKERKGTGNDKVDRFNTGKIVGNYGVRWNIWLVDQGGGKTTKDKEAFKHPALMPEKLAYDHIRSWTNPGDVVLDSYNGAGTSTKMAKLLDRCYIGIDISEEYCEIARNRIKNIGFFNNYGR